ncbi:QueD-like queosine biosynthesis protein [Arthrobacter phage Mufasa8]|uniref:QueD-like queosine biosynthesis protein n=1 Tax=Arthrobacter phage Mufasa8 TaxID=2656526 RepID=A0A649VMT3_9CAUD|nr:QueD-like 6-pyruvoyl-tetrahydropterin synthase [Arthrobacter phage Mufasa8]QGJ93541.1 QueD-like queosine biosynthesis protein [Arthrobacter phage Mufasa8]
MTFATISKEFAFSSSHQLHGLPEDHPCSRLHGHNYAVKLELSGDTDERGFVVDYRDLGKFKDYLDNDLDHRHLNDVLGFQPTAENLASHLGHMAQNLLPIPKTVTILSVSVSETPKTWATVTQYLLVEERNL